MRTRRILGWAFGLVLAATGLSWPGYSMMLIPAPDWTPGTPWAEVMTYWNFDVTNRTEDGCGGDESKWESGLVICNPQCALCESTGDDVPADETDTIQWNLPGIAAAAEFGGDEYLECTDATCGGGLDQAGSFSFGAWIRPHSSAAFQSVMGKWGGGDTGYRLILVAGIPTCQMSGSGGVVGDTATGSVAADTWAHVVCVFDDDADTITAYLDGVASGSPGSFTDTCCDNTAAFQIGTAGSATDYFDGEIDAAFLLPAVPLDAGEVCMISRTDFLAQLIACDNDDPTLYAECTEDADCQRASTPYAVCDTGSNTCRGRTLSCTPTDCNAPMPS